MLKFSGVLNGIAQIDLLDFTTGEALWSRKEQKFVKAAAVSSSGAYGAILGHKTLAIVDMATGENVDERTLPRPVLPHESPHFTRRDREVDAVHRNGRTESLRDPSRFEAL